MDKKTQKATKIVFYISLITAIVGAVVASMLFNGPMVIGVFFGMILGFFLPWVTALMGYTIYMLSNPAAAFKDEIDKLNKK